MKTSRNCEPFYCVATKGKWGQYNCSIVNYSQCYACAAYQNGDKPPHYPVPSTIGDVLITPRSTIWRTPDKMYMEALMY